MARQAKGPSAIRHEQLDGESDIERGRIRRDALMSADFRARPDECYSRCKLHIKSLLIVHGL